MDTKTLLYHGQTYRAYCRRTGPVVQVSADLEPQDDEGPTNTIELPFLPGYVASHDVLYAEDAFTECERLAYTILSLAVDDQNGHRTHARATYPALREWLSTMDADLDAWVHAGHCPVTGGPATWSNQWAAHPLSTDSCDAWHAAQLPQDAYARYLRQVDAALLYLATELRSSLTGANRDRDTTTPILESYSITTSLAAAVIEFYDAIRNADAVLDFRTRRAETD